jgi:hypothetical protein
MKNEEEKTNPGRRPPAELDMAESLIAKVVENRLVEFLEQQKVRDERIIEMLHQAIDAANKNLAELLKVRETAEEANARSKVNEMEIRKIKRFLTMDT